MLYLLFDKHLSVEPAADIMSTILGAKASTGFVAPLANEAASGLTWFIDVIRRRPTPNLVAHANETSAQVPIAKWWFHAVSNSLQAHLFASPTRLTSAPDEAGVLPEFAGVMVQDRPAMYFKYDKAHYAISLAHVFRELEPVGIGWNQGSANDTAVMLREIDNSAHDARSTGTTARFASDITHRIERRVFDRQKRSSQGRFGEGTDE